MALVPLLISVTSCSVTNCCKTCKSVKRTPHFVGLLLSLHLQANGIRDYSPCMGEHGEKQRHLVPTYILTNQNELGTAALRDSSKELKRTWSLKRLSTAGLTLSFIHQAETVCYRILSSTSASQTFVLSQS